MYFIIIESCVFSDLSHCTNTIPVLKSSLFCFVIRITVVLKVAERYIVNLRFGRCKIDTREGNHCH